MPDDDVWLSIMKTQLGVCCFVDGSCMSDLIEEECLGFGGSFILNAPCIVCPSGIYRCSVFYDKVRLLVVDCSGSSPVMVDRTSEAVLSFSWSHGGYNFVTGDCVTPSCPGGSFHYRCQFVNSDGGFEWCSPSCGCDLNLRDSSFQNPVPINPFLDDPVPGDGCSLPLSRSEYDSSLGQWRNSVNANWFIFVTWKPGYPEAFGESPYAVWRDFFGLYDSYVEPGCSVIGGGCSGQCGNGLECVYPCVCLDGACVDPRV